MQGSGVENILETIYGKNTVTHISSGKAISRALRGHLLVDAALQAKLVEALDPDATNSVAEELGVTRLNPEEKKEIDVLYGKVMSGEDCQETVQTSEVLAHVKEAIAALEVKLSEQSKTAKLWIQYSNYINIVKMFLRAERTGN